MSTVADVSVIDRIGSTYIIKMNEAAYNTYSRFRKSSSDDSFYDEEAVQLIKEEDKDAIQHAKRYNIDELDTMFHDLDAD